MSKSPAGKLSLGLHERAQSVSSSSHQRTGSGGMGASDLSTAGASLGVVGASATPATASPGGLAATATTPGVGLATERVRTNILDRPIPKVRAEVSESAFLFLFGEVVQWCQSRSAALPDLLQRLSDVGHGVGVRFFELQAFRSGRQQRYTDLVEMLRFVSTTIWKTIFGKEADSLEKATGSEDTYWISDDSLLINKFIGKDAGASCASFVAGIVQGILDAAEFKVKVTTIRYAPATPGAETKVYIKIKLNTSDTPITP